MSTESDYLVAQEGFDYEQMVETPGWRRLVEVFERRRELAKESLLRVDPTDSERIASLQTQANECTYILNYVQEQIERGKKAREVMMRREKDGRGR